MSESREEALQQVEKLAARVTELELQLACADASLRSATLLCTPEERQVLEACRDAAIATCYVDGERHRIAYEKHAHDVCVAELANRAAKAKANRELQKRG